MIVDKVADEVAVAGLASSDLHATCMNGAYY